MFQKTVVFLSLLILFVSENLFAQKTQTEIEEEAKKNIPKPEEPKIASFDTYMFDFDVDTTEFPELKQFEKSLWEYAGDNPNQSPENNEWIFEMEWNDVAFEIYDPSNLKYKLVLTGNGKRFETIIRPARTKLNIVKYRQLYEQNLKKHKELLNAEIERIKNEEANKK